MITLIDLQYGAIQIPYSEDDPSAFFHKATASAIQCEQKRRVSLMSNPETEEEDDDSDDSLQRASKRAKTNLLTEEEKRANHIASEQKRRNTIRTGFKEMTDLVPTLKNVNHSKSTILFKAADYIKYLDKRSQELRDKVASLQARVQRKSLYTNKSYRHQHQHHNHRHASISIPVSSSIDAIASPSSSTTTASSITMSPSSCVNNSITPTALVVPNDDFYSAPSLNIPADDDFHQSHHDHLLTLRHLSQHHHNHIHH